jgi:hypothetical protein
MANYDYSELDRIWFEQNPTRSHRLRPRFLGEPLALATPPDFVPPPGWQLWVVVRQLMPGLRTRYPVHVDPEIALDVQRNEYLTHAMLDLMQEKAGQQLSPREIGLRAKEYLAAGHA